MQIVGVRVMDDNEKFEPRRIVGYYEGLEFEPDMEFESPRAGKSRKRNQPSLNQVNSENIDRLFHVVNVKGRTVILHWGISELDPDWPVAEFWNRESFNLALANRFVEFDVVDRQGNPTRVKRSLAKWWLESADRKLYDRLIFDARAEAAKSQVGNPINLWRGYGVEEDKAGSWSFLQGHIYDVIAAGNQEHFDYIMRWAAFAVQNPTVPAEVALVLFSKEEGTGKGTLGHALRKLFGAHGLHISQYRDLVGQFNAHLAQCAFLFIDEALWPGHKDHDGILKALITEPTLHIESKGFNKFQLPNALTCLFCSNKTWVVPAGEDARRYAVFEVSDVRKGDAAYFNAIRQQLNDGGLGRMLYDLKRLDLAGWDIRSFPQTSALSLQKVATAEPKQHWLADILNEGNLPRNPRNDLIDLDPDVVRGSTLYAHARRRKGLERATDRELSDFIKEFGAKRDPKLRGKGSFWKFPALLETRDRWRKKYDWWPRFDPSVTEWAPDEVVESPYLG